MNKKVRKMPLECRKCEFSIIFNLRINFCKQISINQKQPLNSFFIVKDFTSFIEASHASSYHRINQRFLSVNLKKLSVNFIWFSVSSIQKADDRNSHAAECSKILNTLRAQHPAAAILSNLQLTSTLYKWVSKMEDERHDSGEKIEKGT